MTLDTLMLAIAAILFVAALVALAAWAFKTLFAGRPGAHGFARVRDKRLGVVETAMAGAKRKLLLVRRDDVEHLIIVGGPVDVVVETGLKGRPHLEPPLDDVIIAKSETRPAPGFHAK